MTKMLYRDDAYRQNADATVTAHTPEGGIVLDQSLFYPQGGGQPGDSGHIEWSGGTIPIATSIKGEGDAIVLVPGAPEFLPPIGAPVHQVLDWSRRFKFMRVHTALHLLSVVIPRPVTGGAISAEKGRLDFLLPEGLDDKEAVQAALDTLIARDLPVTETWISDAQLRANPGLVKTMSVKPPMGQGRIRMVGIGEGNDQVDLQPCGGTHVARTGEIGSVTIGKVENKGRENRRVHLLLD
jgi:misacylated tRNA(Ala) deacylase